MPKNPVDKIVLVVTYTKVQSGDEDQDVYAIVDALRDRVEDEDIWLADDDHDDETPYSFTVLQTHVVDIDVAEVVLS